MKTRILAVIAALILNLMAGCCTCETWRQYVETSTVALEKEILPDMKAGTALRVAAGYDKDFAKNDIGVVEDLVKSGKRILAAAKKRSDKK